MAKKTNTKDLIKAISDTQKQESSIVLERIKEDRSSKTIVEREEKVSRETMDESTRDKPYVPSRPINKSKKENKLWIEFNEILDADFYRDKKETFLMSLSGDCLSHYEKLSNGIGYKLGTKVPRNEIIRKVLEDFMHNKRNTLETIINKL